MNGEIGEGGELEEMLADGWLVDNLVFEDPGEVVGDKDRVKTCREGRVDVGAGTVPDHPGVAGFAAVVGDEATVGVVVLFVEDLDGGEMEGEAGALELAGLLFKNPLGHEDQTVTGGQVCESLGDVWEELDLLIGDGLGEAFDAAVLFRG